MDQGILVLGLPPPFPTNFSLDFHSKTLAHKPGPCRRGKEGLCNYRPGSCPLSQEVKDQGSRHRVDLALLPEQALDVGELDLAFIVFPATSPPL